MVCLPLGAMLILRTEPLDWFSVVTVRNKGVSVSSRLATLRKIQLEYVDEKKLIFQDLTLSPRNPPPGYPVSPASSQAIGYKKSLVRTAGNGREMRLEQRHICPISVPTKDTTTL